GGRQRPPLLKVPLFQANDDVRFTHPDRYRAATGEVGRPEYGPGAARISSALVTPIPSCQRLSRAGCHRDARPFFCWRHRPEYLARSAFGDAGALSKRPEGFDSPTGYCARRGDGVWRSTSFGSSRHQVRFLAPRLTVRDGV